MAGSTVAERINNAIVRLGYLAQMASVTQLSAITKAEVSSLEADWLRFWNGGARALVPDALLARTLADYLTRYAHAWAQLPSSIQRGVPRPQALDFELSDLVNDTTHATVDAMQQEGRALEDAAKAVRSSALSLGVVAIGILLAWGFARRSR